jgi:hypothetical protein
MKKDHSIHVPRDIISKLWKNQLVEYLTEDVINSQEYQAMIAKENTKYKPPTKFTKEELAFVVAHDGAPSECSKQFQEQFGKTITKEYVIGLKAKQKNKD